MPAPQIRIERMTSCASNRRYYQRSLPGDKARTEGVEPSSSGSKPGMLSVTPRPHKAEREGVEPTVDLHPRL